MRTPLRRSIAQVLKIARAGGRSLRQRIWSDAYRFPRGSAQDPGPITARLMGLVTRFSLSISMPNSSAIGCHAWLSVRRPERRLVRHALLKSHGLSCGRQLPQMTAVRAAVGSWGRLRAADGAG